MLKEFDEFVDFCFEHGGTLRNHKQFGEMARQLRESIAKRKLQIFFDEVMRELEWCDEIEETGVDPLVYARDEINKLQRHSRRVNRPLVSQDALYLARAWDTVVDNGYLTQEFVANHAGVISHASSSARAIATLAAAEQCVHPTGSNVAQISNASPDNKPASDGNSKSAASG